MTYAEIRKIKYAADRVRCIEILYSVINEIENDNFEDTDFTKSKKEILNELYNIKISKYKDWTLYEDFEDTLYKVLGDNYILFIPPESELVIKLKKLYKKRKDDNND